MTVPGRLQWKRQALTASTVEVRGRLQGMADLGYYRRIFDLSGKRAYVIGAGSGIGAAAATGLAAFGAEVVAADLNIQLADETATEIVADGGKANAAPVDLSRAKTVETLFRENGPVDILVCTPAVNVRKPLLDYSEEEFEKVIDLNLKGTFLAMREAGGKMAKRGSGSIIVFSSIRSQVVEPGQGVYAATKAGALQLVRAMAAELGPTGVRANAIAPGVVETPLTEQIKQQPEWYRAYAEKNALGRWSQPSELVGAVVFLASQASSYVTGSLLYVDGGWTAIDGRFTPPLPK